MYPKPFNPVYGIFVHHQLKELTKKGCRAAVISPVGYVPFPLYHLSGKWRGYRQTPPTGTVEEIVAYYPRYLSFPHNILFHRSGAFMAQGVAGQVKSVYSGFKFDLIHAHVALPDGFAALVLKEKYPVPVVVTIHGMDLLTTIHRNKKCRQAVGRVFKQADHIVTVSNKLRNIAVESFGCKEKITTIANGIFPRAPEIRQGYRSDKKIMLSVSNLVKIKGIDLNLQAFAALMDKHPDLVYKIIGDGPDLNRLKGIAASLNIPGDRIHFMGRLSNREAVKQMSEADIFSLPSWREGFGVVYIEAMSQGRPVIACQGEGIEDVIRPGENGFLVKPRDLNSLIETLDYLLTNPETAANIGANAQKIVLENYTWDKNAEKTIDVYKKVLGV